MKVIREEKEAILAALNTGELVDYRGYMTDEEKRALTRWVTMQSEDSMRFWLRVHESLTFAYSISFFFFIQRGSRELQAVNAIVHTLLLFAFVTFGVWALISYGLSPCADYAYGKTTFILSIINLAVGCMNLLLFTIFYGWFKSNDRILPNWLLGEFAG